MRRGGSAPMMRRHATHRTGMARPQGGQGRARGGAGSEARETLISPSGWVQSVRAAGEGGGRGQFGLTGRAEERDKKRLGPLVGCPHRSHRSHSSHSSAGPNQATKVARDAGCRRIRAKDGRRAGWRCICTPPRAHRHMGRLEQSRPRAAIGTRGGAVTGKGEGTGEGGMMMRRTV